MNNRNDSDGDAVDELFQEIVEIGLSDIPPMVLCVFDYLHNSGSTCFTHGIWMNRLIAILRTMDSRERHEVDLLLFTIQSWNREVDHYSQISRKNYSVALAVVTYREELIKAAHALASRFESLLSSHRRG
ncbi:hypothetical protein KJ766_00845 [Patescibacteria group bacterium]|nr:hypothetical protein [Patescibacteria group bacterium]